MNQSVGFAIFEQAQMNGIDHFLTSIQVNNECRYGNA